MIYEDEEIKVYFSQGITIDAANVDDAIDIDPRVAFNVHYDHDLHMILLKPVEKLRRGQEYHIILNVAVLEAQVSDLKVETTVKVYDQYINVERKGILFDDQGRRFININISTAIDEAAEDIKTLFPEGDQGRITVNKQSPGEFTAHILLEESRGDHMGRLSTG